MCGPKLDQSIFFCNFSISFSMILMVFFIIKNMISSMVLLVSLFTSDASVRLKRVNLTPFQALIIGCIKSVITVRLQIPPFHTFANSYQNLFQSVPKLIHHFCCAKVRKVLSFCPWQRRCSNSFQYSYGICKFKKWKEN